MLDNDYVELILPKNYNQSIQRPLQKNISLILTKSNKAELGRNDSSDVTEVILIIIWI